MLGTLPISLSSGGISHCITWASWLLYPYISVSKHASRGQAVCPYVREQYIKITPSPPSPPPFPQRDLGTNRALLGTGLDLTRSLDMTCPFL